MASLTELFAELTAAVRDDAAESREGRERLERVLREIEQPAAPVPAAMLGTFGSNSPFAQLQTQTRELSRVEREYVEQIRRSTEQLRRENGFIRGGVGGGRGAGQFGGGGAVQLAYGLEDLVAVLSNGGSAGQALRAASNNLSFVLGSLGGAAGAFGILGASLGSVVIPMLFESEESAEKAAKSLERLKEQMSEFADIVGRQSDAITARERTARIASGDLSDLTAPSRAGLSDRERTELQNERVLEATREAAEQRAQAQEEIANAKREAEQLSKQYLQARDNAAREAEVNNRRDYFGINRANLAAGLGMDTSSYDARNRAAGSEAFDAEAGAELRQRVNKASQRELDAKQKLTEAEEALAKLTEQEWQIRRKLAEDFAGAENLRRQRENPQRFGQPFAEIDQRLTDQIKRAEDELAGMPDVLARWKKAYEDDAEFARQRVRDDLRGTIDPNFAADRARREQTAQLESILGPEAVALRDFRARMGATSDIGQGSAFRLSDRLAEIDRLGFSGEDRQAEIDAANRDFRRSIAGMIPGRQGATLGVNVEQGSVAAAALVNRIESANQNRKTRLESINEKMLAEMKEFNKRREDAGLPVYDFSGAEA
ncbi:hypothetical protein [Alienimonas sp. DA493]|uniref:hypothetical protein n=1 Tax=Alienimonas sp. DA493 TaxID=3373605 RepID=UPI003754381B